MEQLWAVDQLLVIETTLENLTDIWVVYQILGSDQLFVNCQLLVQQIIGWEVAHLLGSCSTKLLIACHKNDIRDVECYIIQISWYLFEIVFSFPISCDSFI